MPTCKIQNAEFSHEMTEAEAKRFVKRANRARIKTEKKVDAYESAAHGSAESKEICNWLLTSFAAKFSAAVAVALEQDVGKRPTLEEIFDCAETLDLTAPIPEPVRVYAKKKETSNEFRPIAEFGFHHRTAQRMVRRVLEVRFKPLSYQYCCRGRGVPYAISDVKEAVAKGNRFFAKTDIKSYFTHFDEEKLSENLPLPHWAVENVVCGRHMTWEVTDTTHSTPYTTLLNRARLGIPQGSSISPLIANIECSKLDLAVTALFNYMDDFLNLALTMDVVEVEALKLKMAVAALPGGHFDLITKQHGDLADGCVFLGHYLRLYDHGFEVKPSKANCDLLIDEMIRFQRQCQVFKSKSPQKTAVVQAAADSWAYLEGWKSCFKECDDLEERHLAIPRAEILSMLDKVGATTAEMKATASKVSDVSVLGTILISSSGVVGASAALQDPSVLQDV